MKLTIYFFIGLMIFISSARETDASFSGLDHWAHDFGMNAYVQFFKDNSDKGVEKIVKALKDAGEFDNKIFIISADHGFTEMPWNYTVPIVNPATGETLNIIPETSCKLKLDNFNSFDSQAPELVNNNLHIWELGEVMKNLPTGALTPEGKPTYHKVLAPVEIVSANKGETTTNDITQASVIVALNGPMAHIYVKGVSDWNIDPNFDLLIKMAGLLNASFAKGDGPIPRLASSVEAILIRLTQNSDYVVYNGATINAAGQITLNAPIPVATYFSDNQKYIDSLNRVIGMNHPKRSGDIVLIMKDATTGGAIDRYTTGVACKSWHGSLNPSDSYVPFVVAYPGGNKFELNPIIQKVCANNLCEGNWKNKDLIMEIIKTQYSGQ